MCVWPPTDRLPREKHPIKGCRPTRRQDRRLPQEDQIAHINQTPPKVHRVCPVLQAVHTTPSRKTHPTVQTTPKRRQIPVDPAAQGHHLRD